MNVCTKEYGFSLQVSILKWEIISFFIQGIDQKSSQNLSKNPPEIEVWRPLEASWRRPGPSWASWGILAGCISRSGWASWRSWGPLGVVLGATWGRLGPSWGVSWGILGSLVASGRRLRLGFLPRWSKIEPFHLASHFVFDCSVDFSLICVAQKLKKSLKYITKIILFGF